VMSHPEGDKLLIKPAAETRLASAFNGRISIRTPIVGSADL